MLLCGIQLVLCFLWTVVFSNSSTFITFGFRAMGMEGRGAKSTRFWWSFFRYLCALWYQRWASPRLVIFGESR